MPTIKVLLVGQAGLSVIADAYSSTCHTSNIDEIVCGQRFWTKCGDLKNEHVAQRRISVRLWTQTNHPMTRKALILARWTEGSRKDTRLVAPRRCQSHSLRRDQLNRTSGLVWLLDDGEEHKAHVGTRQKISQLSERSDMARAGAPLQPDSRVGRRLDTQPPHSIHRGTRHSWRMSYV